MKRVLVPAGLLAVAALVGGVVAGMPTTVARDVGVAALAAPTSTTVTATTVAPPPTTTAPSTTTTPSTPPPLTALRVVVADAAGDAAAATAVAEELRARGFGDVTVAVATARRDTTTVLYEPGFEYQAIELVGLLDVEGARRPAGAVTTLDEPAALWVLVGRDV